MERGQQNLEEVRVKEINCEDTKDPICPFCGWILDYEPCGDPVFDGTCEEMECPSCEKEFDLRINVQITYTTEKPEELEQE